MAYRQHVTIPKETQIEATVVRVPHYQILNFSYFLFHLRNHIYYSFELLFLSICIFFFFSVQSFPYIHYFPIIFFLLHLLYIRFDFLSVHFQKSTLFTVVNHTYYQTTHIIRQQLAAQKCQTLQHTFPSDQRGRTQIQLLP